MPRYPHTKLFKYSHRIILLSGPHIQVLDAQNGNILHSTSGTVVAPAGKALSHSGPIRCSGMSKDGRYLATAGDDKRLEIWELESFTLLSSRELSKKPTSIQFTRDNDVLVSDKFGDVFRWTLSEDARDTLASRENSVHGELVLGHASLLTSCLLTYDEKFIITADRDEHIRVSWYPEGYVIECYCLGHNKYVSATHIPMASPAWLVSGGGDHELKVWDWMTGRLQWNIAVFSAVEPFIKVTVQNGRMEENHSDEEASRSCPVEENGTQENQAVFVVRRISSFFSDGETHIVFSAVGATAVFEFSLAKANGEPDIRHHDFGKPVIDFTLCEEGLIWVLLDADFCQGSDTSHERPRKLVEVIRWSNDQRFVDAGDSALLDHLNTICSLPATAGDLKALDLYSDLSLLPKSVEGDQGNRVPEQVKRNPRPDGLTEEGAQNATALTKRALGRLKHKLALDQLHRERVDSSNVPGPDAKKMKCDSDNEAWRVTHK